MTIDNSFSVKKMKKLEFIYVAFSGITKLPYVECDENTYDDLIFVFSTDEAAREFADACKEKNIPIMLAKIEMAKSAGLFLQLYSANVNAVKYHDGSGDTIIQLKDISPEPDWEKIKKEPLPVMNPALSLPAIYFLQELRRPNQDASDQARMKKVRDLEEEMLANLIRSRFLLPGEMIQVENERGKRENRNRIPYIRAKNGNIYLPIFTCFMELKRFMGKSKEQREGKNGLRIASFPELPDYLVPESSGFILDPNTLNLILSGEHIRRLVQGIQADSSSTETGDQQEKS